MRTVLLAGLGAFFAMLVAGNLAILSATFLARKADPAAMRTLPGIKNVRVVDSKVLRGAAPSNEGYRSLAKAGVATVVDLRAEDDLNVDNAALGSLGVNRVHIPIRDGQIPSSAEITQFIQAVNGSPGLVFVHCGAGVGRTGSMAGAYLVATGQATPREALVRNLAVGPPSLEQVTFVATGIERPNPVVTAVSRLLDAPRRTWARYIT